MPAKVSVIISVYNGSKTIISAIESIRRQTYGDYELLMLNDGSDDDTYEIMRYYESLDSRVKLFNHEVNQGLTSSLNELIRSSSGKYIARMDADDMSYPDRFEKQVDYLEKNLQCGLVSCWVNNITTSGLSLSCFCFPDSPAWIREKLNAGQNPIVHSSVMIRAELLNSFSIPYRFKVAQDYDLWLRMSEITEIGIVPEILVALRNHASSISRINTRRRYLIHNLIKELHYRRLDGKSDDNWQELEQEIYNKFEDVKIRKCNEENATESYLEGLALIEQGQLIKARKKFWASLSSSTIRYKAICRYLISFLPTIMVRTITSFYFNRLRKYGPPLDYIFPLQSIMTDDSVVLMNNYINMLLDKNQHKV